MSAAEPPLKNSKKPKKLVNVRLLTGHEHQTYVDVKAKFQDVFNQVAAHYGLREVEYFGLAEHKDGEYQFISNEEKVQKHAPKAWKASSGEGLDKYGKPFLTVHFRVQYFVDNAILLREKITRQLYYLQLKENVLGYRYLFSEERCFQLAAFALQTDMGIYSPSRHGTDYFDPREYFPAWVVEKRGHEYLTHHVPTMHQDLRNTTRSDAQLKFIREASLSPAAHNLHFYRLKKRKTDKVFNAWLGICPKGVEIYEDSADGFKDLISTFFWPDIGKLYFEKKKFEIRSVGSWDGRKFTYYTDSDAKSKFLLSLCRSSHMFQMSVQAKLSEIRHLDAEDKRYRESYIYSDARDLASSRAVSPARSLLSPKKAVGAGQRYSVVSNTSSNTTSGIVSDKLHISFDESEEFEDEGMSEIMIDSPPRSSMGDYPPRPNMGTPMLTTPKQGRGRLVPFSPKTPTGLDRKVKEVSRSPVRRSGSNASQGSKGSGHADLSPITSNGSYRSRLQQHQQMLQGARLQQMAIQPQPFVNQGRTQSSPQSKAKRAPSPSSVSIKSQSFNLPPKSSQSSGTPTTSSAGQVFSLPPKVPVNPLQSPAQARPRVHESPQRPVVGQGTPKLQPKALPSTLPSAAKPPIPPQQPTAEKVVEEDSTALRPVLPVDTATPQQSVPIIHQPFSTTHTIPHEVEPPANQPFAAPLMNPAQQPYSMQLPQSGLYQPYATNQTSVPSPQGATSAQQPYTAQQVQVKQPQQFLAHQVTPGQPKVIQQYYPQQDQTAAASAVNKPASAVSQFCGQQHTSAPLQQFAQEQPVSQQQFAVPLSLPQQPKYAMPVQPAVPKQIYVAQPQPHQQFLVPVPQQQFTVVHSKSQKQYAVQPQPSGLYPSSPLNVTQPPTVYAGTTGPVYTTQPPQYLPGNTPQYTSPVIHQYQFEEQKPSKPLSKNPSRGDSFKNDLGSWQLHQKSSSAPCNRPTPLDAIVLPDLMTSEQSLVGKDSDTPSTFRMSSSADDLVSLNSSVAMAEIDKAYSSLFDGYDADYLASETEELERFNDSDDSPNASFRIGEIQPILHHSVSSTASPNTSFSYEDLEKALDQVILASQETDGATDKDREEALKAKRTRIAVKNKKEKLHPELEEIRGNVKEFSLPLITALFNDTNLLPTPGSHGSDLMYDTSTICSTDSRWSCDTDSRRLSSSYPSSTGTMISLYSASRPFSWHSEHFDLDAQLAASMRMSSRRPAALFDNARSEPRSLNEVHPNPPVASWTQAIAYGNPYGLGNGSQIDRYSPELLASQHMIPPKISSGGHTKPDSNIKTLKENVGIA